MSRYIDIEPYERKPGGDIKEHTCRIEVKTVFANGFGTVHEQRVKTEDIPTADVLTLSEVSGILSHASEFVEGAKGTLKIANESLENGNKVLNEMVSENKRLEAENDDLRKAIKAMQDEDVMRIRYGEWQQDDNGDFVCSECMGALSDIFDVMHAYVRDVDIERVEICPFCGARMCVRVDEKQKREEAAENRKIFIFVFFL